MPPRSIVNKTPTEAEINAAWQLMADGAEFERLHETLLTWMNKRYGFAFVRTQTGNWAAQQWGRNLYPTDGKRKYWITFHEMIVDLLERIARTSEDVEAEFLKS